MTKLLLAGLLAVCILSAEAREQLATTDLSYLLGEWSVERRYLTRPDAAPLTGHLSCSESLEGAYVHCRYELANGERRIVEEVYFNYNKIYETHEALWLSASWPIKVIMSGTLDTDRVLRATAEFAIEDGIIEYVQSEHRFGDGEFEYRVAIRTSGSSAADGWLEHMVERATKIN